ncbi:endopeptidase, partial [Escherichia coli]|nr:endopeptidase [Escherichia coli]
SSTKSSAIKKPVSWSWRTRQLLICRYASVMSLHLMPDTRGN